MAARSGGATKSREKYEPYTIPRIPVTCRNLEIETAEKVENEQAGPVGPALLTYEKLARGGAAAGNAPELKEGGKALVTVEGKRIKNDDTLLEDLGIKSEAFLYMVQELAWHPKAGDPIDKSLEDRLQSEIISA